MKTLLNLTETPVFDLSEVGGRLLSCPAGEGSVEIELSGRELFVGGRRIVPYIPSEQATFPESTDVAHSLRFLEGLPLLHPLFAQFFHDHPEFVPESLRQFMELVYGVGSGLLFPRCDIVNFYGRRVVVGLFFEGDRPHYNYINMDRLPRTQSYPLLV